LCLSVSACSGGDEARPLDETHEDESQPTSSLEEQVYELACGTVRPIVLVDEPYPPSEVETGAWSPAVNEELHCAYVTDLRRPASAGDEPDWWVFITTGDMEGGWLDLSLVCPSNEVYRGENDALCAAYRAGGARQAALADALRRLPVRETIWDAGTLVEQLEKILCAPTAVDLFEAPPLVHELVRITPPVSGPDRLPAKVGATDQEGFCGDVEVLARTREVPAIKGSPFGDRVIVPWIRVRLGPPANLKGWMDASAYECQAVPGTVLCQFSPFWWDRGRQPSTAAMRTMKELRSVPPAPDPHGAFDLAVTAHGAPRVGDPCSGTLPSFTGARVKNIGQGPTPPQITVSVGGKTTTVEFVRGLRPGESFWVVGGWEQTIVIDPEGQLHESHTANNRVRLPPDPQLICR
jgi:hypothetical protein